MQLFTPNTSYKISFTSPVNRQTQLKGVNPKVILTALKFLFCSSWKHLPIFTFYLDHLQQVYGEISSPFLFLWPGSFPHSLTLSSEAQLAFLNHVENTTITLYSYKFLRVIWFVNKINLTKQFWLKSNKLNEADS